MLLQWALFPCTLAVHLLLPVHTRPGRLVEIVFTHGIPLAVGHALVAMVDHVITIH